MFICKSCLYKHYESPKLFLPVSSGECEMCRDVEYCADISSAHLVPKRSKEAPSVIKVVMAISFDDIESANDREIEDAIVESLDTSNISVDSIQIERC